MTAKKPRHSFRFRDDERQRRNLRPSRLVMEQEHWIDTIERAVRMKSGAFLDSRQVRALQADWNQLMEEVKK